MFGSNKTLDQGFLALTLCHSQEVKLVRTVKLCLLRALHRDALIAGQMIQTPFPSERRGNQNGMVGYPSGWHIRVL